MVADSALLPLRSVCRARFWVVAVFLSSVSPAFSQTAAQANIIGVVTDESGAVLPGVSVTATSPSLQVGAVSAVTDGSGEYRLSNLPLGTYEISYALDGFQSVKRSGVRLTAGFTAQLDIPLKLGSLNEAITVSGASPVVDVASSTPTTSLTRETLELIPTSRNGVQALLAQVPGARTNVDVGGNTAGAIPIFRAFGNSVGSWPVIEGIAVASPASTSNYAGVYNDYSSFEEAQVSSLGNDAEVPGRGINLNAIVKSGGNSYHGSFTSSYTNPSMISDNVSPELATQGLRGVPIKRRWDYGGDLSGFAVPDKLWFYAGGRYRVNDNYVLDCIRPDTGGQCETTLTQKFYSGKATYQATNAHRLIGYYQRNYKSNNTGASSLVDWYSRFDQQFYGNLGKGEWQGTLGKNVVASALVGYWNFISWQYPMTTDLSSVDIVTLKRWGSSTQTYYAPIDINWYKVHSKGTVSWYLPDGFLGNHNFKAGLDFIKGWSETLAPEHVNGNYIQLYRSLVPYQVQVFNLPIHTFNDDHYYGSFLSDEWRTTGGRLTLNLGFRLAFDRGFIREQSKEAGQFASIYPAASYPKLV